MKKLKFSIKLVSFVAFFYVMGLFGILPIALIWMVYRILKDGEHSGETFDKHFYEFE